MRQRGQCIICHRPAAHGRVCFRYGCGTTARARGWYNAAQVLKRQRDHAQSEVRLLQSICQADGKAQRKEAD